MIYMINNLNRLEIFYTSESLENAGHSIESSLQVTEEDYKANDCTAYIKDGVIYLGKNPEIELKKQIRDLKAYLQSTDYVALKIIEGDATREDYADILKKRSETRKEINTLESKL